MATDTGESFAERFGRLRDRAGLTKTALAEPRYSVSYVSQIESGRRRPAPGALSYFARRLGVSEQYLLTGVPDGLRERVAYLLEESRLLVADGQAGPALERAMEAADEAATHELTTLHARALAAAGQALVRAGEIRRAIDRYEEALEVGLPDIDTGLATATLARAYVAVGDLSYALDLVESYLGVDRDTPLDAAVAAELHTVLVSVYFERGDMYRAERAARRAVAAAGDDAGPLARANALWASSRVLAEGRRWEEALEQASRARILLEGVADRRRLAGVHNVYALLCIEHDPPRLREAAEHLDVAERLLGGDAPGGDLADVEAERARLALLDGRAEDAVRHATTALDALGPDRIGHARTLLVRGRAHATLDRRREALDDLHEAAAAFAKVGARQQEASCWREIGELELAAGRTDAGLDALRAGLEALDPHPTRL